MTKPRKYKRNEGNLTIYSDKLVFVGKEEIRDGEEICLKVELLKEIIQDAKKGLIN